MRRNYSRAAFFRMRDRISCKSAQNQSRLYWNALYQASINRLLWTSMLLADNEHKRTITCKMVSNAYHSALCSAPKRLYALEF